MTGTKNNPKTFSSALKLLSLFCRIKIRKGLNELKKEIPGGDTLMQLGLKLVIAFIFNKCFK